MIQDAAGAASQARDKLMERKEKLEVIVTQKLVTVSSCGKRKDDIYVFMSCFDTRNSACALKSYRTVLRTLRIWLVSLLRLWKNVNGGTSDRIIYGDLVCEATFLYFSSPFSLSRHNKLVGC